MEWVLVQRVRPHILALAPASAFSGCRPSEKMRSFHAGRPSLDSCCGTALPMEIQTNCVFLQIPEGQNNPTVNMSVLGSTSALNTLPQSVGTSRRQEKQFSWPL